MKKSKYFTFKLTGHKKYRAVCVLLGFFTVSYFHKNALVLHFQKEDSSFFFDCDSQLLYLFSLLFTIVRCHEISPQVLYPLKIASDLTRTNRIFILLESPASFLGLLHSTSYVYLHTYLFTYFSYLHLFLLSLLHT